MDARFTYDTSKANEPCLVSLVMTISGAGLRRHVARMLWFDLIDQMPPGQRLVQLKQIAEPQRLDEAFDFDDEQLAEAMGLVGYEKHKVEKRVAVHREHCRVLNEGRTLPECERVMSDKKNHWACWDNLIFFYSNGER